jgi:hypothetical protein
MKKMMSIGSFSRSSILIVAALGLAGCTRNLDMEKVKASIGDGIKTQTGATVKSVTCPEKREVKAQDSFDCTVQVDGGSVAVTVSQKDAAGNIGWELKQTILNMAALEKVVVDGLTERGDPDATVECGPRFRPGKAGDSFECTAKWGSETAKVKVTVKDAQGNVGWALEEAQEAAE